MLLFHSYLLSWVCAMHKNSDVIRVSWYSHSWGVRGLHWSAGRCPYNIDHHQAFFESYPWVNEFSWCSREFWFCELESYRIFSIYLHLGGRLSYFSIKSNFVLHFLVQGVYFLVFHMFSSAIFPFSNLIHRQKKFSFSILRFFGMISAVFSY